MGALGVTFRIYLSIYFILYIYPHLQKYFVDMGTICIIHVKRGSDVKRSGGDHNKEDVQIKKSGFLCRQWSNLEQYAVRKRDVLTVFPRMYTRTISRVKKMNIMEMHYF